jgi:hypothetical protein
LLENRMRKMILMALAGFLWRKFMARGAAASGRRSLPLRAR